MNVCRTLQRKMYVLYTHPNTRMQSQKANGPFYIPSLRVSGVRLTVSANPDYYYRCTCEVRLPGTTQTSFGSPLLQPSPSGEYSRKNSSPGGRIVLVGRAWAVFFLTLTLWPPCRYRLRRETRTAFGRHSEKVGNADPVSVSSSVVEGIETTRLRATL